ncbi:MAG: porin [Gammaproteobacteria bacterium]|nr:porin [Gammaproteobacteria bacterium]
MNKKLLAVAVGATLAAAPMLSAQAKVKVYGKALVEVVSTKTDVKSLNCGSTDCISMGDRNNRSRWGIKASQDLGNGLKVFANFEFSMRPGISGDKSDNETGEERRVMKVGVKGGFGTLTLGRDHGAYKKYGAKAWDPVSNTFLQARRSGAMAGGSFGHNSFRDDLIGYKTPKGLGGFTFEGQVRVDEAAGKDGEWHAAVQWKGGPLEVVGAMNNKESGGDQNKKVAARYKAGGITVFGQYEDVEIKDSFRANNNKLATQGTGNFLMLGGGYKFGNNLMAVQWGQFRGDTGYADADHVSVSITHFFNKKSRVYAGYSNVDVSGVDSADMWGAGLRYDF